MAILLFCLSLLACTHAALACTPPAGMKTDVPPGGPGQPTEVSVSFAVVDFMDVDDGNQQVEVDFFLEMSWTDPRLAGSEGCRLPIVDVWVPRIRLLNSHDLRVAYRNRQNAVAVGADGSAQYLQRFTGAVSSYHNLGDFPFDSHVFSIDFVSVNRPNNLIDFVEDEANTWIADRLNVEGWRIGDVHLETGPYRVRDAGLDVERIALRIAAEREPEFYLYRIVFLLFLVVAMSWVIFWVPPGRFEFQIGIGATTMLTAMAFIFSISSQLPTLGYLTRLDRMIVWAIVLVFLSIVEALVAGRLVLADREQTALRLDRVSRYCFPVLLLIGWVYAIYG